VNIKKDKDNYKVESGSHKGKFYTVDPAKPWCDCADFKFREMGKKGACKHIKAVRELIEKKKQKTLKKEKKKLGPVAEFIGKQGGAADSIELIERFGQETIDSMIRDGELIEEEGKIRLLK
jgi:hypothetical protein